MKNIKNLLNIFILLSIALGFNSCRDDDKTLLDLEDFPLGGFVRFAEPFPNVVNISDLSEVPTITVPVTFEAPDGNVVSYTMKVTALIAGATFGPVDFGPEITSFPAQFNFSMTDLVTTLGIDISTIGFGDTFTFTGTAVNNQGVVYEGDNPLTFDQGTQTASGGNNSGDLLSEIGYRNAFEFAFAIPCPPLTAIIGDWTIEMIDLFGDGWDGAFLTVSIDGVETDYTIADGDETTHIISVPAGAGELRFTYTSGAFEEEHVYSVVDPNGIIYGPFGPNPELCPPITP